MRQALADLVVIELAQDIAGSYCGKQFADLGADVVKVEPPTGDPMRVDRTGAHGHFLHLNTNKRSVVLDRASAEDRGHLARLLERADLVITAGGDGALDAWQLDWPGLHARVPQLVVGSITAFGLDGPYAGDAHEDVVLQAMGGVVMARSAAEDRPLKYPAQTTSHLAGSASATAALAAVLLARASGVGALVDTSAWEVLLTTPQRLSTHLGFRYRGDVELVIPHSVESLLPAGVFPCADGYVSIYTTPQRGDRMLATLDDDELRAWFADPGVMRNPETRARIDGVLYPWLLEHTRDEIATAAQRASWSVAPMNRPRELLEASHLHQRAFWAHVNHREVGEIDLPGAPYRFAEGGWSLRRLSPAIGQHTDEVLDQKPPAEARRGVLTPKAPAPKLPLEGIRVLDMTTVWAGPYATMLMADLGAEVIRIENPWVFPASTKGMSPRPAPATDGLLGVLQAGYAKPVGGHPDRPYNRHSMNNSVSRNKLSCTIDVRRPEGRELVLQLVEQSDVFVENFKASSLPGFGLHPTEMQERNPGIVVLRLPPTGLSGDWSPWMGFGPQFDALTGFLYLCGHPDSDPTTSPSATTYMDCATGPASVFALLGALHYRAATGRGQLVEMAQIDNVIHHLGDVLTDLQLTGEDPARIGNRSTWRAPQGIYRSGDKWLALSVGSDEEWGAMTTMMGRPELAADPRYATVAARLANQGDLDADVEAWTDSVALHDAWRALQAAGIPAGPVFDDTAIASDPHLAAREFFRPTDSRDVGSFLHPVPFFRGVPIRWDHGAPVLGEHNDYVLRELLGLTEAQIAEHRSSQLIGEDYLDSTGVPY